MRYYETVYIINPNFEQSRLDSITKEVEKQVSEFGKVISHNLWGKKKLAYQIDAQKYGTFLLLYFESDNSSKIIDFESFMKLNSSVLRSQTIRLNNRPSASSLDKTIAVELEDDSDGAVEKPNSKKDTLKSDEVEESAEEEESVDEVEESAEEKSEKSDSD